MNDTRIRYILIISIVIGIVLSLASLFVFEGKHFTGVVSGAFIGSLNFYFLVLMVVKLLEEKPDKIALTVRFVLKYGLVMALAAAALIFVKVSPLGFIVGISNFVVAIFVGGLMPMKGDKES